MYKISNTVYRQECKNALHMYSSLEQGSRILSVKTYSNALNETDDGPTKLIPSAHQLVTLRLL